MAMTSNDGKGMSDSERDEFLSSGRLFAKVATTMEVNGPEERVTIAQADDRVVNRVDGPDAGERCLHLSVDNLCALFDKPERPAVCSAFGADAAVCGSSREEALQLIEWLEGETG